MTKNRSCLGFACIVGILLVAAFMRLWRISQIPPGLHGDESYHLLQAQAILAGKSLPIYITGNNGYEALVVYLAAIPLAIMGPITWAGRLAMAWAGVVGVATTIRCGREMFPGRRVGTFAGLVLATLLWNVNFSRFGSQPILAAVIAAGGMAALWRAIRTGRRWAYVGAGACLGLGLYAYQAYRIFLFMPAVTLAAIWVARRLARRSDHLPVLVGGLLAGGTALLIFAPLGVFFLGHPDVFLNRAQQTVIPLSASVSTVKTLLSNAQIAFGSLFFRGDVNWRHNFSGRPALDVFQAVVFLLGLAVTFWHWRKPQSWSLWLWLIVGFVPSIITEEIPHFGRTIIVTPALALLAALGIELALKWIPKRIGGWSVGLALFLSIVLTTREYFVLWANRPEVFDAYEGQLAWAGRALQSAPAGARLYATPAGPPSYDYPDFGATADYLLGQAGKANLRTYKGQSCLVVPPETHAPTAYAIRADEDKTTLPALKAAFPAGTYAYMSLLGDKPDTIVFQVLPGQTAQVPVSVSRPVAFGDVANLVGYTLDTATPPAGGKLDLSVVWKAASISKVPYKAFIHLIGPPKADGNVLYAQLDQQPCADSYPTWWWRPGELVIDRYTLQLPTDIPAGTYSLNIGWYKDPNVDPSGTRLQATDSAGQPLGDSVPLEKIVIPGSQPDQAQTSSQIADGW